MLRSRLSPSRRATRGWLAYDRMFCSAASALNCLVHRLGEASRMDGAPGTASAALRRRVGTGSLCQVKSETTQWPP